MAYRRKGSKKWTISYRVPGQKQPEKEYFDSKRQAEARELEVKAVKKINPQALAPQPTGGLTFRKLAETYFADRKLAPTTLERDLYALDLYPYPIFGDHIVEEITEDDLTDMVKLAYKRGYPGAALRVWERVRAILRWGKRHKLITKDPGADFIVEREKEKQATVPPTREEVEAILDVSPPHLVRVIMLAYHLGVRPGRSELFDLRWTDFDLAEGWVRVRSANKGGLPWRDVPVAEDFLPILTEWHAEDMAKDIAAPIHWHGHPVTTIQKTWEAAKKKAGITRRMRLYDLRHHFATALLERDVDSGIVAGMMGHTTDRMVHAVYQRVRRGGKRAAIAKLPALKRRDSQAQAEAETAAVRVDETPTRRQ